MAAAMNLRKQIQTVNTQKMLFDQKLRADTDWCSKRTQDKYDEAKKNFEAKMDEDFLRIVRTETVLKTMGADSRKAGKNTATDKQNERKINLFLAVSTEVDALSKACALLEEDAKKAEASSP